MPATRLVEYADSGNADSVYDLWVFEL